MWGQDGNDVMHGGDGNDDMYGELGDDTMFGDNGSDAMLGDRGGVVDELMNPSDAAKQFTVTLTNPPQETYVGMRQGTLDHRVDLLHDIDGDVFVGTSSSAPMRHAGLTEGGNDRIRGGNGADNIHAGFGDDLANGDSGGDQVFGDDGADVLWGGKGCDAAVDTPAVSPDCYPTPSVFDPTARGTNDRFIDHIYGGTGATSGPSIAGALGSDILDWRPRGGPAACTPNPWPATTGNQTNDPCSWFQMTGTDDDNGTPASLANNQHHQGTDWMYGGWDRDIMQGDVTANGPNPGDRQIDWTGSYDLYSVCNSANGGFNDVRQQSPAMQTFLQKVAFGDGAGQASGDSVTAGTSAFRELAMVYPADNNAHGAGSAYPTTPGHFDTPACGE
jgi:RTX calcium-binding nonapeptide repeat (4 copies)